MMAFKDPHLRPTLTPSPSPQSSGRLGSCDHQGFKPGHLIRRMKTKCAKVTAMSPHSQCRLVMNVYSLTLNHISRYVVIQYTYFRLNTANVEETAISPLAGAAAYTLAFQVTADLTSLWPGMTSYEMIAWPRMTPTMLHDLSSREVTCTPCDDIHMQTLDES